ncbi:hypothetical protein BD413DRAFT_612308 [Trametes elegans]|nr:hypothetical protein BD413DRAFT_612308 [Trametes elegans]
MHDVATLIGNIAQHVEPSYPIIQKLPPRDGHLHEAMQRLISDYLVQHKEDPIPLTPGVVRAIGRKPLHDGGHERGRYSATPLTRTYSILVEESMSTSNNTKRTLGMNDDGTAVEAKRPRFRLIPKPAPATNTPKPKPQTAKPAEPLPEPHHNDPPR